MGPKTDLVLCRDLSRGCAEGRSGRGVACLYSQVRAIPRIYLWNLSRSERHILPQNAVAAERVALGDTRIDPCQRRTSSCDAQAGESLLTHVEASPLFGAGGEPSHCLFKIEICDWVPYKVRAEGAPRALTVSPRKCTHDLDRSVLACANLKTARHRTASLPPTLSDLF